jgi:hypothetical protein
MEIDFGDLLAPVTDLGERDPLEPWRWLVGPGARPLLLTALGDMFVEQADGTVQFIDTYEGNLKPGGADRAQWKLALQDEQNLEAWFAPELVAELRAKGLVLAPGQSYSPVHPPILGGSMEPDNFECVSWRVHFMPMGQIHEQVKDLPPGTPIKGIKVEWK